MNKDVIYPSMVIRTQEETINKLEEEVNKQAKAIQIYEKELKKHDNNWNELKKFLIDLQKLKGINQQGFSWGVCQECLDKIKELESKGKL
jgi:flagellar biosynthesis chaperone FliJ